MALLELKNIEKSYGEGDGKTIALKKISLSIEEGEMIAIMGPSGSGKSTLLNIIGGLDSPSCGEYYIDNELVSNFKDKQLAKVRNKTFGFVVQYFALLEDYNVEDNISIPLEYGKVKANERKERIKKLVELLGIKEKIKKFPKELSGGQNQRVAIARALANNPKVLLADEPTGALDRKTGEDVINIFKILNKRGKTIIIVTHDEKVGQSCNRIIRIQDGAIVKEGVNYEEA